LACFLARAYSMEYLKNRAGGVYVNALRIALVGSFLLLVSCGPAPEGNSSDGKRWFGMQHCDGCHGEGGQGGKAPKIQQLGLSYRELLNKVRKPESAIMPSYPMERLSDQDVADIFSYLQEEK